MKTAFSQLTLSAEDQRVLFSQFRTFDYSGLQLKANQYSEYMHDPTRFIEEWGADAADIASGLISGGLLDETGIASLRALFKFAHAVGSERVIFCHAQPRQGLSSNDIQRYAQMLAELGREAQQQGVSLSLH